MQKSLRESLKKPEFLISDFAKFDRPAQIHVGFQALHEFVDIHGRLPDPHDEADAEEVYQITKSINNVWEDSVAIDKKLIKELAYGAAGDLSPMVAVFGGLVAQEVLKACSGKFHPIQQYMYFDSLESLPSDISLTEESCRLVRIKYNYREDNVVEHHKANVCVIRQEAVMMVKLQFLVENSITQLQTSANFWSALAQLDVKC